MNKGLNNMCITDDLMRPKNKSFNMYYENNECKKKHTQQKKNKT